MLKKGIHCGTWADIVTSDCEWYFAYRGDRSELALFFLHLPCLKLMKNHVLNIIINNYCKSWLRIYYYSNNSNNLQLRYGENVGDHTETTNLGWRGLLPWHHIGLTHLSTGVTAVVGIYTLTFYQECTNHNEQDELAYLPRWVGPLEHWKNEMKLTNWVKMTVSPSM